MPTMTRHAHGTFCWPELYTRDQAGAKAFYTRLFGWGIREFPLGPDAVYTIFTLNGQDAAACYGNAPEAFKQDVAERWMSYAAVDSADHAADAVRAAGGTVVKEPFDIPSTGRMALLRDPLGAAFLIWEDKGKPGIGIAREPGALQWTELLTSDTERSAAFYAAVFGWQRRFFPSDDDPAYHLFASGEAMAGGMTPIVPEMGATDPVWVMYFNVASAETAVREARRLGAAIVKEPETIEGVGTYAFIADPAGARFGVLQPAPDRR